MRWCRKDGVNAEIDSSSSFDWRRIKRPELFQRSFDYGRHHLVICNLLIYWLDHSKTRYHWEKKKGAVLIESGSQSERSSLQLVASLNDLYSGDSGAEEPVQQLAALMRSEGMKRAIVSHIEFEGCKARRAVWLFHAVISEGEENRY